jgi:AcrR family transcriptional regulator
VPRPRDPGIDDALTDATLRLLADRGFARMSIGAVAGAAGVGKPAIYRRFSDKAELVAAAIASRLPAMEAPDLGDTRAEMHHAMETGWPADAEAYTGLIGGLMAERGHHPELIEAYRETVLLPRRALARAIVERGQARGDIRAELDPEMVIDMLSGPLLARAFAGRDTGPEWRERAFALWWASISEESP